MGIGLPLACATGKAGGPFFLGLLILGSVVPLVGGLGMIGLFVILSRFAQRQADSARDGSALKPAPRKKVRVPSFSAE